jgi:hypothetical protein
VTDISGLALTYADRTVFGNKRIHTLYGYLGNGTDTVSISGITCPVSNFGLRGVDFVELDAPMTLTYDYTNERVMAWVIGSGTFNVVACSGITPQSGIVVRIRATGYGLA